MQTRQAEYNKRWREKANPYDRLSIDLPRGDKERIKNAAAAAGQSLTAYLVQAAAERMERDGITVNADAETPKGGE